MKKLKIFDPEAFLNIAVDAYQAKKIAEVADFYLKNNSHVQYGIYENGEFKEFSSKQSANHTHAQLAFATKRLKKP